MRVYLDDCYGASAVDYIVIFNCLIDLIGNSFNCFGRILIIVQHIFNSGFDILSCFREDTHQENMHRHLLQWRCRSQRAASDRRKVPMACDPEGDQSAVSSQRCAPVCRFLSCLLLFLHGPLYFISPYIRARERVLLIKQITFFTGTFQGGITLFYTTFPYGSPSGQAGLLCRMFGSL